MTEEVLVIDIGGTKTNVSFVVSNDSEIKVLNTEIFPTYSNPELQIQKIVSISTSKKPSHISLSLPGLWDKNGILCESINLKSWVNYPFINNLKKSLDVRTCIWESDVICGAMGEYHFQTETYHDKSLLYLNLGTGIGAAFIKDGKPFKSGMPWHALTLRIQKLLSPEQDKLISAVDLLSGASIIKETQYNSVEKLFTDYKKGDVEAFEIISRAQLQLASWLINLFYLFAPNVIVLNGGLTYDWEVLCEEAIDVANEELNNQIKILPSKLKEMAPIYGAYLNFTNATCHSRESGNPVK